MLENEEKQAEKNIIKTNEEFHIKIENRKKQQKIKLNK